ncbi:MAG: hypothetical protein NZM38_00850 [Cytophagales bacterium]|nr:hypothetical protein [Cytophagales bacterium]MDW8383296.1 hypothetical protein [Flammeovirgaceae bacterium]
MNSQKVVIVEFYGSHYELLYSHQCLWEALGYEVHFFLNQRLKDKVSELCLERCSFFSDKTYWYLIELLYQIFKHKFQFVVCNTAHGIRMRNFVLLAKWIPSLRILGVCHYVDKLRKGTTQKIISWGTEKYWILSRMFFENGSITDTSKVDVLYAVFRKLKPLSKQNFTDKLRIALIGEISPDKKDFETLLRVLSDQKNCLNNKIEFVCLGNARTPFALQVREKIASAGLESFFVFYDKFIPDAELLNVLLTCHAIATLIHPSQSDIFRDYLYSNISGAYNLAYWASIPLLLEKSFEKYSDFQNIAYFYDPSELGKALLDLQSNRHILLSLQKGFQTHYPKISLEFQVRRMKKFLRLSP